MSFAKETSFGGAADWESFRRAMPSAQTWAYLDHAAVAPLSGPASLAMAHWVQDAAENGSAHYPAWSRQIEHLRSLAAELINAVPEEIAFIPNTSTGVDFVAEGFPWKPGDNVVTRADEFPSNQYPWLNLADRGVETRRLPTDNGKLDLDQLEAACDAHTRIVTVSWVAFASGWRHDLDRLAQIVHRRGALLFVDAIQGLGVFPLDVKNTPIDFLAADGHKWLLGPEGAGVFFTRREHLNLLRPVGVGWNSVKNGMDFHHIDLVFKDTATRYEGGSQNVGGLLALEASIELLRQFGAEAISRRVLELTDLAWQRLEQIGAVILSDPRPAHRSGIISFEIPGQDLVALQRRCMSQNVLLSCRAGRLRISPHAYNNASDIDRLIEALR
jgi:cysteine desulfurase / selenocysteine lyase